MLSAASVPFWKVIFDSDHLHILNWELSLLRDNIVAVARALQTRICGFFTLSRNFTWYAHYTLKPK